MQTIGIMAMILAIPIAIMAVEAWKPKMREEDWTDRELQQGFWYRFLCQFSMMLLGLPSLLLILLGVLGGGILWIAAGVVALVLVFVFRYVVIPALWPSSGNGDDAD